MFRLVCAVLSVLSCIAFDENVAKQYANIAGALYCGNENLSAVEAWNCGSKCIESVTSVKACKGWSTVAIVGLWQDGCIVAFEGSQTTWSFLEDADAAGWTSSDWEYCSDDGCWVHSGFLREWQSHSDCIKSNLASRGCGASSGKAVRVTGHSLGAAVDMLAMIELKEMGWNIVESYTFGTPRTGNHAFVTKFDSMFAGKYWRVTHASDPVPLLPPAHIPFLNYEHVAPEMYYKGNNADGYKRCDGSSGYTTCIEKNSIVDSVKNHGADHLRYMDVNIDNGVQNGCKFGYHSIFRFGDAPSVITVV